jgi:hypothetical protein
MKFSEYILNEGKNRQNRAIIEADVEDSFEFQDLYCTAQIFSAQVKSGKLPSDVKDKLEKILIRIYAALASKDLNLIKKIQRDMFKQVSAAAKKLNKDGAIDESFEELNEEPTSVATIVTAILYAKGIIAGISLVLAISLPILFRFVAEPIIKDYIDYKYADPSRGFTSEYSIPQYLKDKAKNIVKKIKNFIL